MINYLSNSMRPLSSNQNMNKLINYYKTPNLTLNNVKQNSDNFNPYKIINHKSFTSLKLSTI